MRRITRREFLWQTAAAATGIELGRRALMPPVAEAAAPAETWPNAAVAQGTNDDTPAAILKTALEAIGGIGRFVKQGQVVCIKPNITWDYPPHTASSTDPELLAALIGLVKEAGAKRIIVLDNPTGIAVPSAQALRVSGIGEVLDAQKVEKVFPDASQAAKDLFQNIDLPDGKAYPKLSVFRAAVEADVRINMAVAKSHVVLPVTLCLKHMMGFLANPPALHADLERGIVDLNGKSPVQAQLHVLEAIRVRLKGMAAGYETDETNPRLVKRFNQIVAGTDPVLIDSYACINYFGRQPREIRYVKLAGEAGLGETDVKKATAEGRLRVFTAGQAIASPTPTAAPTAAATDTPLPPTPTGTPPPTDTAAPPTATVPVPTNTPLPTATPESLASTPQPIGLAVEGAQRSPDAFNPNGFLSCALLPAAAVVTGTGLVISRRLRAREEAPDSQGRVEGPGKPEAPAQAAESQDNTGAED